MPTIIRFYTHPQVTRVKREGDAWPKMVAANPLQVLNADPKKYDYTDEEWNTLRKEAEAIARHFGHRDEIPMTDALIKAVSAYIDGIDAENYLMDVAKPDPVWVHYVDHTDALTAFAAGLRAEQWLNDVGILEDVVALVETFHSNLLVGKVGACQQLSKEGLAPNECEETEEADDLALTTDQSS